MSSSPCFDETLTVFEGGGSGLKYRLARWRSGVQLLRRVATMLAAAKAGWHIGNTEARSHRYQTLKVEPGRYRDLGLLKYRKRFG